MKAKGQKTGMIFVALLVTISFSTIALASSFTGITGFVTDPVGEHIRNARVELIQSGKVIGKTRTNRYGYYSFPGLDPGSYKIKAVKKGFYKDVKTVELEPNEEEFVNLVLSDRDIWVSIYTDKFWYKKHEPVKIFIVAHNATDSPITLGSPLSCHMDYSIHDPYFLREHIYCAMSPTEVEISSHATYTWKHRLSLKRPRKLSRIITKKMISMGLMLISIQETDVIIEPGYD